MIAAAIDTFTMHDLLSPETQADPYPVFQRLRQESPVHEDPHGNGWVISRYDDIAAVLADKRFSARHIVTLEEKDRGVNPIMAALSKQMLFQDPPDHTRLRGLVSRAFTPQRIESLRPQTLQLTTRLLDEAVREGGFIDFMDAVAIPLPVAVIARMLGLPDEDHRQLQIWSLSWGKLINGCPLNPSETVEAHQGIYALIRYLTRLIAEKRKSPGNDMLSDLIAAGENGDRLDPEELIMNVILLFAAGHLTTTHVLGNSMLALLRNPDAFQLLSHDPSIAPSAVNELIRFEGPIQATARVALEDVHLGGRLIRKGDKVTLLLASGNHDETRFVEPERLDLRRTGSRCLSFGHGLHACVGAALGRMEAQVVLSEMARRFPFTWLEENEPERLQSIVFNGFESLPITLA